MAFEGLRGGPHSLAIEGFLRRARAVMIFPRTVKASLILGGEGGNGVLVAKGADGGWSDPAFYSLGAPSVGLQVGYRQATVVFFFIDDAVVQRALHSDFTLGASSGVALGNVIEAGSGEPLSKPMYQLVEAQGAYAGVSFDGYVIAVRNESNDVYYGARVTPREILIERRYHQPESGSLLRALAERSDAASTPGQ